MNRLLTSTYRLGAGVKSTAASIRWSSTSVDDLKVGDVLHGYKLEKQDYIKELNVKPYLFRHEATGAEHLHVHRDGDSNNVFCVSLRTTPENSKGIAHILEHLALCGSKKYQVRDPFFKMRTRSLATFMNAMTGPDCTFYPFSTQNKKDFENLLRIYLDAVFFPRLRHVDFRQEGWRLEHSVPDKKDTPIEIKGVVYNEMKGVFSSTAQIYGRHLLNNLFPDTTYGFESGGDPDHIPELSHEELLKFYKLHYHPSNSKFYTYGDQPVDNHLKLINELVLSKFSENSQARERSVVKLQEHWTKTKTVSTSCPLGPMSLDPEKQTTTSRSYLLPTTSTDFDDIFALQILSTLLLDGPNAPFHKALIESNLGSDYSPCTGFESSTRQPFFSVGLQGLNEKDVGKVQEIIDKTFSEAAASGFSQERIDAILHNIELSLKHNSGNFGLRLLMNLEASWNHDGDIMEYLKVNQYVDKFKKDLAQDKQYWAKLIGKYFISNKHQLILNMNPDSKFEEKRSEREKALLENKISKLNDVDRQTVLYEGMELMKIQNNKDDTSVLPCLEPSKDISRDLNYKTELKFESFKGVKVQLCEQPTNEIVYFRAMFDVGQKLQTANLIDYLPLFCDVATKLGAGSYNRHELSQKIQLTTGGLGVSTMINPSLSEFDQFKSEVFIGSYCLRRNVGNMFDLWSNVFKQIHLEENKEYLMQLVKATASDLSEGISNSGHLYATRRSSSSLSSMSALNERLSGLSYVAKIKDIANNEAPESIVSKLQDIAKIAFNPFNMRCSFNAEPEAMESTTKQFEQFIEKVQTYSSDYQPADVAVRTDNTISDLGDVKFPFATHFVAKSMKVVPKMHEDFPKLVIMSKLISSKYLLPEVREKGGAYGTGALVSNAGILSFFSFRDPNTDRTMQTFDKASEWIHQAKEFSDEDIEESKLGVFQDVDRPVEPGRRGLNFFTTGESDEFREEYRRRLLDVSKEDVVELATKYLNQDNVGTYII